MPCDGCGLTALTPEHIAEGAHAPAWNLAHSSANYIGILFIALAPPLAPQDDLYSPGGESKEFVDPLWKPWKFPVSGKIARLTESSEGDIQH